MKLGDKNFMNFKWKMVKTKRIRKKEDKLMMRNKDLETLLLLRSMLLIKELQFFLDKKTKVRNSTKKLTLLMIKYMIGAQRSFKKLISNSTKILMHTNVKKLLHSCLNKLPKQYADNCNKSLPRKMMRTEVISHRKIS